MPGLGVSFLVVKVDVYSCVSICVKFAIAILLAVGILT